jgi:hypothetical protein
VLTLSSRPRRKRLRAAVAGILAAIIVLLAGIWLGGHPGVQPAPLRMGVFEAKRTQVVTQQALNILTSRIRRPG